MAFYVIINTFARFFVKSIMTKFRRVFISCLCMLLSFGLSISAQETTVKVSGVITSAEDGLPIIGAAVIVGPGVGVSADFDGNYSIEVAPGTELTFTSIGFVDAKVTVPQGETFVYDVVLQVESMVLEDAVVIAYGVRKK